MRRDGPAEFDLGQRQARIAALLLLGVELLMLLPLLRGGEPLGDDLSIHLSEIAQLSRAIAGGDVGLWNPGGNLGFPSGYYYQVLPQLVPALAHVVLFANLACGSNIANRLPPAALRCSALSMGRGALRPTLGRRGTI